MKRKKSLKAVYQAFAEVYEALEPLDIEQRRWLVEAVQQLLEFDAPKNKKWN